MKTLPRVWLNCIQLITLIILSASASAQLKADFAASPSVGCPPMVVTFQNKSTGGATEWKWDLGNGTISFLQNPIATYFNPGKYTIKLVVKNQNGQDSLAKLQYIVVNELPTTNFGASDTTGCYPLKVAFTDSSVAGSGTIQSWQWDFGDGTLSSGRNPNHTYINAGDFTVTLRVINSNGCVKVFTRPSYIKIRTGVKASFSVQIDSVCKSPAIAVFTNTSTGTGNITYKWNFGNGQTSTLLSPSTNYTTAGTYIVTLIAANSTGCTDTLVSKDLVKIAFSKADFSYQPIVCVGRAVTLNNTSVPAPLMAAWSFGDGTIANTLSASKTYSKPGTYTIKLISEFSNCTDSVSKNISVVVGPTVDFDANNLIGCKAPHTVNFTNKSLNGVTYFWDFGDGKTSSWETPSHTYITYGNFAVKLVVTNANGCKDSLIKNQFIKVVAPDIISIAGLPVRACLPYTLAPVANIVSNQAITFYKWDFGDGTTSTDEKPRHDYTVAGSYTLKLVVGTAEGCTDTLTLIDVVKVGIKPKSSFYADPLDLCAQIKVNFYDQSSGQKIHEWFWDFGDGGTSVLPNPSHQYNDTGKFDIMLVTTNFGCSDTIIKVKYVHISPPIARFDTSYNCGTPLTRNFIDKSLGATAWAWDFGDGSTSTEQSPTYTFAKPGNYKVGLTVTNGICQHTTSKTVRVVEEKPTFNYTDSIMCRNARMTYSVTNVVAANIVNYSWYPKGFGTAPTVSNLFALAHYYTTPGPVNPAVVMLDVLGCKDTLAPAVQVRVYGPTAGFSTPVTSSCYTNAINFIDTSKSDGINPITSYIWNFGDGNIRTLSAAPFMTNYNTSGLFGIRLTVVDNYGCRDSVFKPNHITISKPSAKLALSDTLVCPNVPVIFKNQSLGNTLTYNWSFGDGTTSTTASPTKAYPTEGNYRVSMLLKDKFNCTLTIDTTIHVIQTTARFLMSDSFSSCPPLLVDFTNQSKGFTVFSYDFGDGGISTLNNPSHIYTYPGTYFVKLGVRNNGGCTDTLIKKIVIEGPTGTFKYNPLIVCNPGKIDFVATTQNAVKYIWDYNDGTTIFSNKTITSHVYTSPGIFVPKIILEDISGCRVPVVGKDTIHVKYINTNIVAPKAVFCDTGTVVFRDSTLTNDQIKSFTWNFGDGQTASTRNTSHKYLSAGLYTVKLTIVTNTGCIDSTKLTNLVKVVNSPGIKITGDTSSCLPGAITYKGELVKADTSTLKWSWSFGNGKTDTLQNPLVQQYITAGNFTVKAVVTNYDGCKDSTTRTAVIHPLPVVTAGIDTTICKATSYKLKATGAEKYTWNFDASLNCLNCDNPVATPAFTTSYVVTGRSQFGCFASDTVMVNVTQPFVLKVAKGDTLCVGESFTMDASGAEKYEWSPSIWLTNGSTAKPTVRPDSTITYQVIGRNNKDCFADTGYVTLKVYPIPQMEISNGESVTVNVGNALQLVTKNSPDIKQWRWLPATWLSCNNCPNPKLTPKESRVYQVVATNDGNCVARDEITVNLVCNNSNVFIPNTFSPNNDGNNDRFYPRGKGVFSMGNMKIFNRWGQIVFENNNFNPNDANAGWDGKMKGKELLSDVYVYTMQVVCENSAVFPIKGNITMLR